MPALQSARAWLGRIQHRRLWLLAAALAVALALAVFGLRSADETQWVTAKVDQGSIVQRVSANGTLNPVILVNVGTQISGTVIRLHTDFSQRVKAGQLLAELDPSLLESQIRQSEANLSSARATLENAQLALKRNENLRARGFVSDGALDGLRRDLETARAQVAQVEAQLARDKTNLGYSKIRSPIDGIVIMRGVDVGQTVAASFQTPTLFQIARDLRNMQIDTSVSEADVGSIRPGQEVKFRVDAFRERDFVGKVRMTRLNPLNQQNVVTYNVVIDVDNEDNTLLPGMTAQVSIVTNQKDGVVRVPSAALRFKPPESERSEPAPAAPAGAQDGARGRGRGANAPTRVYLVGKQQEPVAREIKVGISDGRFTEVLEGLAVGDEVIVRAPPATAPAANSGFRMRLF